MVVMVQDMLIALVSSLLMFTLGPLVIDVILASKHILRFLLMVTKYLAQDDATDVAYVMLDDNPPSPEQLAAGGGLTFGDTEIVMARLGLAGWRYDGNQGCEAMSVVDELMDGKQASVGELEEAFYVFDRDEDGFIRAGELCNLMRRLGWKEGARYEDCVRMIRSFDEDGDGKISFLEFRRMMENVV